MKQLNWILTDDVASAVSLAEMYRLGRPVDSNLAFPQIEDGRRKDTGLFECMSHAAMITPLSEAYDIDLHIQLVGYQSTLYSLAHWYTSDRGFLAKTDNVILVLKGVATYLKRPYTQLKHDPLCGRFFKNDAVFNFQKVMEKRAAERQQVMDLWMQPIISSQTLRG